MANSTIEYDDRGSMVYLGHTDSTTPVDMTLASQHKLSEFRYLVVCMVHSYDLQVQAYSMIPVMFIYSFKDFPTTVLNTYIDKRYYVLAKYKSDTQITLCSSDSGYQARIYGVK